MPAVQTTYASNIPAAQAGLVGTESEQTIDTMISESAAIGFGKACGQGANANGVTLGGATYRGVAVRDATLLHDTPDQYELADAVAVISEGDIWVPVGEPVTVGAAAFYVQATGVIGVTGTDVALPGSRFLTAASNAGDLALLRLGAHF